MLIDKTHKPIIKTVVALTLLSTALYCYARHQHPFGTFGSTPIGLLFGIVSLAIMLFASLLGVRKKRPALRVGRGSSWLKGHIWFSLLLIPLVFFHSGMRTGGTLTQVIWVLFIVVSVSGIVGLLIQNILPRFITEQIGLETIYDQIDHVATQLQFDVECALITTCGPLGFELKLPEGEKAPRLKEAPVSEEGIKLIHFYKKEIRFLFADNAKLPADMNTPDKVRKKIQHLKISFENSFYGVIDMMTDAIVERVQHLKQKTLHKILHAWLLVHVPASYTLLALVIYHAVTALWY